MKSIGVENGAIPPVELRKHCKDFAMMHVKNQMAQFKRLGSLGHYCDPYLTLKPEYEARQVEVFGEMAKRGYMYKGLKPVTGARTATPLWQRQRSSMRMIRAILSM